MIQHSSASPSQTTQEIIAYIRTYYILHQTDIRETVTYHPLLGTAAAQITLPHVPRIFCGTGKTAAAARAGAYLQSFTGLCKKQPHTASDAVICAGCSPDDAAVQGLSELLARRAADRYGHIPDAPQIPEEVLSRYRTAYRIYLLLKQGYGSRLTLRDISGSGIQLTAALLLTDAQTGKIAVACCSHPDAGTALEHLLINAAHGSSFAGARYFSGRDDAQYLPAMLQKMRLSCCKVPIKDCSRAGIHMRQVSLLQSSKLCCV